jgi:hypothetical protein
MNFPERQALAREPVMTPYKNKLLPERTDVLAVAAQERSELGTPLIIIEGHTVAITRQK